MGIYSATVVSTIVCGNTSGQPLLGVIPFFAWMLLLFASQCAEMILNKIEKTFNKTYTGLDIFFRDSKYIFSKFKL